MTGSLPNILGFFRPAAVGLGCALFCAPVPGVTQVRDGLPEVLAGSAVGDVTGYALADTRDGRWIDAYGETGARVPASVLKIVTALYGLDVLGPNYRFSTSVLATGPVEDGVLSGDLVLVGGGDPALDANDLKEIVADLAEARLSKVEGRFVVVTGALPELAVIEPDQPLHVGYNPAISGLNLNFNRVRLTWIAGEDGPVFGFGAPGTGFEVLVEGVAGELGEESPPRHRVEDGREVWTLDAGKMRRDGAVWLPVRDAAKYAAEVFASLAGEQGIELPEPEFVAEAPEGEVLVEHLGAPLIDVLRGMLRYSTNLTAEVVGLQAAKENGEAPLRLEESALAMTAWARERYGLEDAVFIDHSGLSDRSRWSAEETVEVLLAESGRLPLILPLRPMPGGIEDAPDGAFVAAKTGTIYFSSGLAGYLGDAERSLAFAVYSSEPERREGIDTFSGEPPAGARVWGNRARELQKNLLTAWFAAEMPPLPLRPMPRP
ncbi:D-alanyl-D-alanine carboxypeptidase/D-alanyl-D-alanine endopeptidase [Amaricoccus tamworthensis]|uniref:D-alanyl-D-alanine carboxypeptidase/D-alanyl-D-alanine endopeptidase n=1 Tax=Amaricoccus tamworthensis TaxID=57002 RepID=UPI003C79E911